VNPGFSDGEWAVHADNPLELCELDDEGSPCSKIADFNPYIAFNMGTQTSPMSEANCLLASAAPVMWGLLRHHKDGVKDEVAEFLEEMDYRFRRIRQRHETNKHKKIEIIMGRKQLNSVDKREASGAYRTADGKAQIEWELKLVKEGLRFSASGTSPGGCGQSLDTILEDHPDDPVVKRMHAVWKRWHLNDMRAGNEYQREHCWGKKELVTGIHTHVDKEGAVKELFSKIRTGVVWRKQASVKRSLRLDKHKIPHPTLDDYYREGRVLINRVGRELRELSGKIKGGDLIGDSPWLDTKFVLNKAGLTSDFEFLFPFFIIAYERKLSGHVGWDEHPEGVLGKPCPVTGYKYGSSWMMEEIPDHVLAEIYSWEELDNTGDQSLHEWASENFLNRHGIEISYQSGSKEPDWGDDAVHGNHYRVTLTRKVPKDTLSFDYWDSYSNRHKHRPEDSDILGCLSSDMYCPETFEEFCSDYGYDEDSRRAYSTWERVVQFARDIKEFFTEEEFEELEGLRN